MIKVRCLEDVHYGLSLKEGKVYDARDCGRGWYAVVDESGEEYAYPPKLFEVSEGNYIAETISNSDMPALFVEAAQSIAI